MHTIDLKLRLHAAPPRGADLEHHADWLVVLPLATAQQARHVSPFVSQLVERRKRSGRKGADSEPLYSELPDRNASRVACAFIEAGLPAFELLTLARKLAAIPVRHKTTRLAIAVFGFTARERERIAEALLAALYAACAVMPNFKSRRDKRSGLRSVDLYGASPAHGFRRTLAEAQGNALARYLSMLPPNLLTPADYLKIIRKLARDYGWRLEFLDERRLARRKAGAFLAVAQGSPTRDAGIVHLSYRPARVPAGRRSRVALVGKGICFDTGGTNLKPAKHMYNMHQDMQGSAVALGTLLALTQFGYRQPVECWLALAMNHIGPKAYKQNDVVTACDGTSIEIVHTDAEGRMVLADTLVMASQGRPGLIIDFATLTGACVYSLSRLYSGVFTNRDAWNPRLIAAGRDSGERVWPFPMDADYDEALRSDIADVKQCVLEGDADHILAARFLQRFVKHNVPWVHLDLAAARSKGGLAHIPTDTTGFGVRLATRLLLDDVV